MSKINPVIEEKLLKVSSSIHTVVRDIFYAEYVLRYENIEKCVWNEKHIEWLENPESRKNRIMFCGVNISEELKVDLVGFRKMVLDLVKSRRKFTLEDWYSAKRDNSTIDIINGDSSFDRATEIVRLNLNGIKNQIWIERNPRASGMQPPYCYCIICNYNDREVLKEWRMSYAQWDKDNKIWKLYPLTKDFKAFDDAIRELTALLDLTPHSDLTIEWYGDKEMIMASLNPGDDYKCDELKLPPYAYQRAGIKYGAHKKRALIADEMGLGKSVQAIGIVIKTDAFPCLVISPKSIVYNWRKEWSKFTDIVPAIFGDKTSKHSQVTIVSYDNAKKLIQLKDYYKSVIVDESHLIKDEKTLRYKAVRELAEGKEVRLLLTGTPIVNVPSEMIPQLTVLGYLKPETKPKFISRYCGPNKTGKNLEELNIKLRSMCMIRRTVDQVQTWLPEKVRQNISIEISNLQEYQEAIKDFETYIRERLKYAESRITSTLAAEALVKVQVLKKIVAKGMVDDVVEFASGLIAQGKKVVIFAHHSEIIEMLAERLKTDLIINGSVDVGDSLNRVKEFSTNPNKMSIIMGLRSGSLGIDGLQDACHELIFAEFDWTSAVHDQAEARVHRNGQTNHSNMYYFTGINTIYEKIYEIIERKRDMANTATGGRNDVSEKRQVFGELMKEVFNIDNFILKNDETTVDSKEDTSAEFEFAEVDSE